MNKPACSGALNNSRQRRQHTRNGVAMIELALVILLMMMIFIGLIDFARVFHAAVTIAGAARAGAQYGSQTNGHTGDHGGITTAADEDSVNLAGGITVTPSRYCLCEDNPDDRIDCLTETCPEGAPQLYVEVQASYLFETLTQFPLIPKNVGLNQVTTIRIQ